MPRSARKKSSTGIYHVVLRGINKQVVFKEDEDYQRFLSTLVKHQEASGYQLFAYCLMNNHIHLLMAEGEEELGMAFRRIGASYVYWYNLKYNRQGHLFQDRFRSEPVETDQYFLTALRYIHQNPMKAGIESVIHAFPWSSYREYIQKPVLCNTGFTLELFSKNQRKAKELLQQFHQQENNDRCLDFDSGTRRNDIEATEIINNISGLKDPKSVQKLEMNDRNKMVKAFKRERLSIRQIERLTGISFQIIRQI